MNQSAADGSLIETERLSLYLIAPTELITLFEDPENLSIYAGKPFTNPHRVLIDDAGPLHWRVPQVKEDPSVNIWFVRWIVLRATNEIIGSMSFHGAPNHAGMIEIGLGIEPRFQNHGYATEALMGMWRWVVDQPGVQTLRYTVSATNKPSMRIIEKFGFMHVGQQMDEIDGPEEIFEMSTEEFRTRNSL
jgi:[ribosomal protein S5]-alanine N-acetyltransferase